MAPNYLRSDEIERTAEPKPMRGQRVLDKEESDRTALKHEREVKSAVKMRDAKCRWPEPHVCRKGFECAHIVDASTGGAMETENLALFCGWIHRRGPESIHGKQLKVEKETALGADWTLSFWRRTGPNEYALVAREIRPFEYEHD